MQKFLFSLFFLGFTINLFAQCKPATIEDKFTKAKQVFYSGVIEDDGLFSDGKSKTINMIVGTENDTLYAIITIFRSIDKDNKDRIDDTKEDFKVDKGQNIYLALKNNETVKLTALQNSTMTKKNSFGAKDINVFIILSLTKEQLLLLSKDEITDYRIELSSTAPLQNKVKSKKARTLLDIFKCANKDFVVKN